MRTELTTFSAVQMKLGKGGENMEIKIKVENAEKEQGLRKFALFISLPQSIMWAAR